MRKFVLAAAFLTAIGTGPLIHPAAAQTAATQSGSPGATVQVPPANLIMARQAVMDLQQGLLNDMKAAVQGKADVKGFKDGAEALQSSSKIIPVLFVPGTQSGNNTKARPNVFTDQAGFAKAADTLNVAAAKLSSAANSDDKAAFAAAFQQVGQACGACHRSYRSR